MDTIENENIELDLLLRAIYMKYGFDFRNYSRASVKRRVFYRMQLSHIASLSEMQRKIIYDRDFFSILLHDLSIQITEMFRNPSFYKALREKVIPELKKRPFIKMWHAGCSTGEEAYSMAILLKEEGLYDKTRIYATDFNETALSKSKAAMYPVSKLKNYSKNYRDAGGLESFADYFSTKYEFAKLDKVLATNILFSNHNLVTDSSFGEMDMIVCRNVLIYFNSDLQNQVFRLFYNSLQQHGFLCLGSKESLMFSEYSKDFHCLIKEEKIYKKK